MLFELTNNNGNTMSLKQQGNHTAIKRTISIPPIIEMVISPCVFIIIWAADAHVLINMWPAWGNFVRGKKYAIRIPRIAAGLTIYHSSMKPMWIFGS